MAPRMNRTQIYLSEDQRNQLRQKAERSQRTMCALIREAIDLYLTDEGKLEVLSPEDPMFELVGVFESDPGDVSVDHDRYLYDARDERP